MAISMLKIRRPLGRLIFNMGIAIPGKTVFLIETAPSKVIMETVNVIMETVKVIMETVKVIKVIMKIVKVIMETSKW